MVEESSNPPEDSDTPHDQAVARPTSSLTIAVVSDAQELESRQYEIVAAAVLNALVYSRGSAIVNIGNLEPAKIIQHFHQKTVVVSAEEILADNTALKVDENTLLVLTGYSSKYAADFEQENALQGFVRHYANQHRCNVLVLSDGMPSPEVFTMQHWWYNGPVPSGECYSVAIRELNTVVLKEHRTKKESLLRGPTTWKDTDRNPIEYKLR